MAKKVSTCNYKTKVFNLKYFFKLSLKDLTFNSWEVNSMKCLNWKQLLNYELTNATDETYASQGCNFMKYRIII